MKLIVRRDIDGAAECLAVCKLDSGTVFYSELLGRESPYIVQVTAGEKLDPGADFIGLYDLDGDQISGLGETWELATDVPEDLYSEIADAWDSGEIIEVWDVGAAGKVRAR